jgi:hypothetical protein
MIPLRRYASPSRGRHPQPGEAGSAVPRTRAVLLSLAGTN